jgi:hypothetical protein
VNGFGECLDIRGQTCSTPNSSNLTIVASWKLFLNININFNLKNRFYSPIFHAYICIIPSLTCSSMHVIFPSRLRPSNVGKYRGLTLARVTKVVTRPHPIIIDDLGAEVSPERHSLSATTVLLNRFFGQCLLGYIYMIFSTDYIHILRCLLSKLSFGRKSG